MNSKQSGPEGKEHKLPKGMRVPKVRTFPQRVWEEEALRAIRNTRKVLQERIDLENRNKSGDNSHYSSSLSNKVMWGVAVSAELRKHKPKKDSPKRPLLKPTTHVWKFPDEI